MSNTGSRKARIGKPLNTIPRPDARPMLALTAGEPAGIGPDLCVQIAQMDLPYNLVVIADRELLRERARLLRLPLEIIGLFYCRSRAKTVALCACCISRWLNPRCPASWMSTNARYVLNTLERAVEGCSSGEFDAMVTAPVHKGIINDAGIAFTGHTEYLADLDKQPGGHDAGGRRNAGNAGHHPPAAERRVHRHHRATAGAEAPYHPARSDYTLCNSQATHCRSGIKSPCRGIRSSWQRRNRHHYPGARKAARRQAWI